MSRVGSIFKHVTTHCFLKDFFKRKCFPKDSLPSVVVNLDSLPWLLFVSQASSYPMEYLPSAKSISRMLKITHCVTAIVMSQEVK